MPRKGENIYKRKDGRWEGRYKKGVNSNGKICYRSVYGATYKEAKGKLLEQKQHKSMSDTCRNILPDNCTVADAVHIWISAKQTGWKASTYATYRTIVEKHILPAAGSIKLTRFGQENYQAFLTEKRSGNNKLSHAYIHQIHVMIMQIFTYLEKQFDWQAPRLEEIRFQNMSRACSPPSGDTIQSLHSYLTQEVERNNRTCLGILLSGCTGIRIGELCALQWKDFDLQQGTMHISKTMQRIRRFDEAEKTELVIGAPKSSSSDREIPLPETLLTYLKKAAGKPDEFILIGKKKPYMEPRTLQYRFLALLKQLKLEPFNYHMLRHMFATKCLISGFDLKSLSELMGHSNVATTMKLYIHTDMGRKRKLMNQYQMSA